MAPFPDLAPYRPTPVCVTAKREQGEEIQGREHRDSSILQVPYFFLPLPGGIRSAR